MAERGRKSKLSEKQWQEIERRHLQGERIRPLAREFDIAESAIRTRISARSKQIKAVAGKLVEADTELKSLPIQAQVQALNLADQLRAVSMHLASAATFGALTSHRLSGLANKRAEAVADSIALDDESMQALADCAALTRTANESSTIGVTLLRINNDAAKRMTMDDEAPIIPTQITVERRSARTAQ